MAGQRGERPSVYRGRWADEVVRTVGAAVTGQTGMRREILAPDDERIAPASVAVARLGAARLERGKVEDIASFEPHYLKEFVAAIPQKTAFQKLAI